MNEIPAHLTLQELIFLGAVEGTEQAYETENGFCYGCDDCKLENENILYYNHIPFTGLYYELHKSGTLALYSEYKNGLPVGNSFTFYESGTVESYSCVQDSRLDSVSYQLNPQGQITVKTEQRNGLFKQTVFQSNQTPV